MKTLKEILMSIVLLCISLLSFSQNSLFKAVTVVSPYAAYSPEGYKDSTTIFYKSDMVIYKMHNHYLTSSFSPDEDGNLTIEKLIVSGETVKYFAYDPQKKYGIMYNEIIPKFDTIGKNGFLNDTIKERRILVDSFLKRNHTNFHFDYSKINSDSNELIISSGQNYNYIETYSSKYKLMGISGDSAILYFNKDFKDIEYELAKTKENKLPYKLQKIRFVYNVEEDKVRNVNPFKVERIYELKKVNDKEFEEAVYYYNLAKKKL